MKIIGVHTDGAFAEYAKIPGVCAWKLPDNTPTEIGAAYEPFGIAVHGFLKEKIAGLSTVIIGEGLINRPIPELSTLLYNHLFSLFSFQRTYRVKFAA